MDGVSLSLATVFRAAPFYKCRGRECDTHAVVGRVGFERMMTGRVAEKLCAFFRKRLGNYRSSPVVHNK